MAEKTQIKSITGYILIKDATFIVCIIQGLRIFSRFELQFNFLLLSHRQYFMVILQVISNSETLCSLILYVIHCNVFPMLSLYSSEIVFSAEASLRVISLLLQSQLQSSSENLIGRNLYAICQLICIFSCWWQDLREGKLISSPGQDGLTEPWKAAIRYLKGDLKW